MYRLSLFYIIYLLLTLPEKKNNRQMAIFSQILVTLTAWGPF